MTRSRVLKNFADQQHITFPLRSDTESKIIRAFDILNETVAPGTAFYGIPNPGTYVIDPQGRVVSKHFEDDYRERVSATDILIQDFGKSADAAREVAETKHLRLVLDRLSRKRLTERGTASGRIGCLL
jgi:alkyl hydroperoxide reductase subunit AhpC